MDKVPVKSGAAETAPDGPRLILDSEVWPEAERPRSVGPHGQQRRAQLAKIR
jgi:hypothetical protein